MLGGLGFAAGCAQPSTSVSIPLTAEALQRKADAEQSYISCLSKAAQYIDDKVSSVANLAILAAPLCYPQFSAFEDASVAGMTRDARKAFDKQGDALQLRMAEDSLRREREGPTTASR